MSQLQERLEALYQRLKEDARSRGSASGQVWHEADVNGHHLYLADTSFGDGPVFRFNQHGWQSPMDKWLPLTQGATDDALGEALACAERAEWVYRLQLLDPNR